MPKLPMTPKKLTKEQENGVRLETMCQGIRGLDATLASIIQNTIVITKKATKQPTTIGSDHGRELPPREVAIIKHTTAVTIEDAPR